MTPRPTPSCARLSRGSSPTCARRAMRRCCVMQGASTRRLRVRSPRRPGTPFPGRAGALRRRVSRPQLAPVQKLSCVPPGDQWDQFSDLSQVRAALYRRTPGYAKPQAVAMCQPHGMRRIVHADDRQSTVTPRAIGDGISNDRMVKGNTAPGPGWSLSTRAPPARYPPPPGLLWIGRIDHVDDEQNVIGVTLQWGRRVRDARPPRASRGTLP